MSQRLKADLALTFCSMIWGATFVVVKNGLADSSVFAFLGVRFTLSALALGLLFWKSLRTLRRDEVQAGFVIGLFLLSGYALQTGGLKYTSVSKSAFITGSSVAFVPLLLGIFWRRKIAPLVWAGAFSAFAGLYLLTVPAAGSGELNRGDVFTAFAAVLFALHIIAVGHFTPKFSVGGLVFVQVATTGFLALVGVPALARAGWEAPKFIPTPNLVFATLATAIGSTVIGFSTQVWAQRHTSPTHTAIFISLEPVFATLTSVLLTHERPTARTLLGATLILAGIVLSELRGPAQAAPDSPGPVTEAASQ